MFMVDTFDIGKNLSKEIHVLQAIRQGIQAQESDVRLVTIQSYQRRSQALDFRSNPQAPPNLQTESKYKIDVIRQGLIQIRQQGYIQDIPNIRNYISPYRGPQNERVDNRRELDNLVDDIVVYNIQQEVDLEEEKGQAIKDPPLPVTYHEALVALYILRHYKEEYQWSDRELLVGLRRFERELGRRYNDIKKQSSIESFVTRRRQLG